MRSAPLFLCLLPLLGGCLQSSEGEGPRHGPPPGGELRLLEFVPGTGKASEAGDRLVVDFVGRYANGEVWAEGPLTYIVGRRSFTSLDTPPAVGSVLRMQLAHAPGEKGSRLIPFQGGDPENEAFQFRRDRGPIIVEHTVRRICRPMELYLGRTGFGPMSVGLGCWPVLRGRGRPDVHPPEQIHDPPTRPDPTSTPERYRGGDALHLAALDGQVAVVSDLLAAGYPVSAPDSSGFHPIHYVGWAQRPSEPFVPALEQGYLEILDLLIANGADVDVRVEAGRRQIAHRRADQHIGQTALGFAVPGCADLLIERFLEHGADPDVLDTNGAAGVAAAAGKGCPETVKLLLDAGVDVDVDPLQGGTPLEHVAGTSAFHVGHYETARVLLEAGADTERAVRRLGSRLRDRGPGPFGFYNRPMARRILELLSDSPRTPSP